MALYPLSCKSLGLIEAADKSDTERGTLDKSASVYPPDNNSPTENPAETNSVGGISAEAKSLTVKPISDKSVTVNSFVSKSETLIPAEV